MTLKVVPFANTLAIIDLVLHPFFHAWAALSPDSYTAAAPMFVAGLQLSVTSAERSLPTFLVGTVAEAASFWLLGAAIAALYNALARRAERSAAPGHRRRA